MTTVTNPNPLKPYQINAINDGFPWECSCGELHRRLAGAWDCRKCRQYLYDADYAARTVIDLRDGRTHYREGQNRAWANYLAMPWTSADDECEHGCGTTMGPDRYVEGRLGHYCSTRCRSDAEQGGPISTNRSEASQMGLTAL